MTGRGVKVLVLVTILLSACTRTPPAPSHTPSPSRAPSAIAWADCSGGFQCGTLQVPLDYNHPEGRKIGLALIKKPKIGTEPRLGSLLYNPGGPGVSGIEYLREDPTLANLNHHFDLVAWDTRGVGASAPVKCLDDATLDNYLSIDSVLDDPQEKADAIQTDRDFSAGCKAHSGDLLPYLDSASTARDMDQIRAAVGDDKLTYIGFSYGTMLGQWYARLFPTRVRALSLDGVVDPEVSANDSQRRQLVGFQQNLDAFFADCRSRQTCAYGRSGDPATKLNALMTRLDATPIRVGSRQLTRSLALTGVLQTLYDQSLWTYLDQGLTGADRGNGAILLYFADTYLHRHADGTYDNLWNGAYGASFCLDFYSPPDIAAYDALAASYTKASPVFGPSSQYSNLQCGLWPVRPKTSPDPLPIKDAPPILLVGGTNDPATPYEDAMNVFHKVTDAVLLTRQGNGHVSYGSSECSHTYEDDYLISLKLPQPGTVCST